MPEVMKTLFLNPPSYEGFDGGAGARYQARREIKSFWYPTWLAQPAAMVPGSRLIDAPPDGLTVDQVAPLAKDYELAVLHTSTPSFPNDAKFAAHLKEVNPENHDRHGGRARGCSAAAVHECGAGRGLGCASGNSITFARKLPRASRSRTLAALPTAITGASRSRRRGPRSRIWMIFPLSWTCTSAT